MGCANGYCSRGTYITITKDKCCTTSIISNSLTNQMHSNKTNNKFLSFNSSSQDNNHLNISLIKMNERHSLSNKHLKIPDNPLPFVKLKPKKSTG